MDYMQIAALKAELIKSQGDAIILCIESSCDETAAAVVKGRSVLSMAVHTQIPLHRTYGGVVPELASRSHVERIGEVVQTALSEAKLKLSAMQAIAVTYGPGLAGALLVGVSYAKGLAYALKLPLVGINHIEAHISANYISNPDLNPPFVCLVASGGHSDIVAVEDYGVFKRLGRTRDDAAGEAFDKVARALGLPYPGGPALEKLSQLGDPKAFALHAAFNAGPSHDFSFSGIKTAVINLIHTETQKHGGLSREFKQNIAASFQRSVVETLTQKTVSAAHSHKSKSIALAGGVAANMALRESLKLRAEQEGLKFYCPELKYCTDNAAMLGCAAHFKLMAGSIDSLELNAQPGLSFTD